MENLSAKIQLRFGVLTLMVLTAALSRVLPHPFNFTPVGAMALFGGAYYARKYQAFLLPLLSLWISDLVLNNIIYRAYFDHFIWFHEATLWVYGSFALIVLLGWVVLRRVSVKSVIGASLLASVLFFVITNFGTWYGSSTYSQTWQGLVACYIAALPYFWNTLAGDLVYSTALFGLFELAQRKFPALGHSSVAASSRA